MIEIVRTTDFLRAHGITAPDIGVIIGTGLGAQFIKLIRNPIAISYGQIPDFPTSTVESHHGRLIYGDLHGKKILAMQGRFHYYEGYDMKQITLPVRVMKLLGCKYLFISNASGNLNLKWKKGDLMMVDDHINLQTENPLRGKNFEAFGPRFPDMSQPYSDKLNKLIQEIAAEKKIPLRKGVYVAVNGPNLETRAEYRFLRMIGADAVGMSTVPEVIVANHMSLPCCAISVLTDDCDPDNLKPVSLAEIVATASKSEVVLTELYSELIARL
ncbi:purine-nucleoside phosphorylase [Pseudochryseolinea flava]|uniref:Purine nucleoside phosphorylase n=1 Tax=Pseudochryseolinea flava TaxID=2059302 RepID=A0A364YA70_9BACT|nr:purine-nucleoside phosphorylase [Pseudochryseolinea flava]RAW03305.1 purine-nucleoside phosphorylase [Pseudochryseolinea flava]